jgi:imidazolonepropionase-like amidohydrolase
MSASRILILLILLNYLSTLAVAQITFPYNGVRHPDQSCFILTNARVIAESSQQPVESDILVRDGRILEVGKNLKRPADALVVDLQGSIIYPGFIDLFSTYGMPALPDRRAQGRGQAERTRDGAFGWNEALRTEQNAAELFKVKPDAAKALRENGFTLVNTHMPDGISRGSSILVFAGEGSENELMLREKMAHHLSFQKGSSVQEYPGSLMGVIALLRQTYLDGKYYESVIRPREKNLSLEYWNQLQKLPQIFSVEDRLDIFRADKIAREFGQSYLIRGTGHEYQNPEMLKKIQAKMIVPLKFPTLYEVEDPYDAAQIDLTDLKHWEMAPTNTAMLEKNGISFCLTADGLKDGKDFWSNLRKAVSAGLSKTKALEALTTLPASWMGIGHEAGSIAPGKWANFVIANGDLFSDTARILETWVKGRPYVVYGYDPKNFTGRYQLILGTDSLMVDIRKKENKYDAKIITEDSTPVSLQIKIENDYLSGRYRDKEQRVALLSAGLFGKIWKGKALMADGRELPFVLTLSAPGGSAGEEKKVREEVQTKDSFHVIYPFTAYGRTEKPAQKSLIFRNATVWTCEKDGILEQTDVWVLNGKIEKIGKGLKVPDAQTIVVDATGKHLTPGLIDEHSHIAISRGVNECTEASTAEVRIGDVINSEDINIYRQLAGGLTTAQLLHGSCNPIGGQSAIIKLRWGSSPDEMKFEGADGFIKFALGENVKRSGGQSNQRFPDTRMGVEQVYMDYFTRAKRYLDEIKLKDQASVRRDLDLEAVAEILEKKRFITCHSYVQSEINMLMKLAEKFGFRVNTFTHILEGYKVADKMKAHGAGGSSFSDWWAYKFEVYEAIPYNGAILHRQGVTTAFNSDDAEMARRLNQEAAKAVKYGGLSEEEALKFVTLNPAKLLHIDHRVGSIRTGKDADLVLWDQHPLAVYSKPDMTLVDGIKYFDAAEQESLKKMIDAERARIVQKMIKLKESGVKSSPFKSQRRRLYHCDTVEEEEDHGHHGHH